MSVEIPPKGTRGARMPSIPGPIMRGGLGLFMAIYRLSGGRMTMRGVPLLILTTVGARSGRRRKVPLTWFADGEQRWLIVASLGGAANHPAWFINLARNPDQVWIEVGRRTIRVRPESLRGGERAEAWRRIVAAAPGYGTYERSTDREIPVVRLTPA